VMVEVGGERRREPHGLTVVVRHARGEAPGEREVLVEVRGDLVERRRDGTPLVAELSRWAASQTPSRNGERALEDRQAGAEGAGRSPVAARAPHTFGMGLTWDELRSSSSRQALPASSAG
jgi:hypothetical protein